MYFSFFKIILNLTELSRGFAAVTRLLKPHVRSYSYDRSGFGGSDPSPSPPTATTIAKELSMLLENAAIAPPYIFIAHSWGKYK
jgi:pimeloyl-ACP methyl ester carboxylesterase